MMWLKPRTSIISPVSCMDIRGLFQYPIRCLNATFFKVSNGWEDVFRCSRRFEIWQARNKAKLIKLFQLIMACHSTTFTNLIAKKSPDTKYVTYVTVQDILRYGPCPRGQTLLNGLPSIVLIINNSAFLVPSVICVGVTMWLEWPHWIVRAHFPLKFVSLPWPLSSRSFLTSCFVTFICSFVHSSLFSCIHSSIHVYSGSSIHVYSGPFIHLFMFSRLH